MYSEKQKKTSIYLKITQEITWLIWMNLKKKKNKIKVNFI